MGRLGAESGPSWPIMPRPLSRPWILPAFVAAILALAVASRLALREGAGATGPTGRAAWIWSQDSPREVNPLAFWLSRDFTLAAGFERAELAALGDEEYLLFLNGYPVGSNTYHDRAQPDRYDVRDMLVPGRNRIVAEVRSRRGAGGFLARLEVDGQEVLASDGAWRVHRGERATLLRGQEPTAKSEGVKVWGRPPHGRWRALGTGSARPLALQPGALAAEIPPRSQTPWPTNGPLGSAPSTQPATLLDWGQPVAGYLSLSVPAATEPVRALLFLGLEPPDPSHLPATAFVVRPPGERSWTDASPRRFRYALLLGATVERPYVMPLAEPLFASLGASGAEPHGWLGFLPPPRLSPMELAIRKR
jgi:hypothetical protein